MQSVYFGERGVHALADGQYGSTGKGALASWLALQAHNQGLFFSAVYSNAGPNSGHTFYHDGEKHVLKQLPSFAVKTYLLGGHTKAILTAGAVIDFGILQTEARKYPNLEIWVHPNAAIITDEDKKAEHSGSVAAVAGTRSGTGQAVANKVLRRPDAVISHYVRGDDVAQNVIVMSNSMVRSSIDTAFTDRTFLEVSQGFSLGINQRFYPKTTSRECTIGQGMADAGLSPRLLEKSYLSMRTYPIRVGDVDGFSSGGYYTDQHETSWEELGQTPELTTVTQRVRRVFTFSEDQVSDAIQANTPDFVFMNFMNYLDERGQADMMERMDQIRDSSYNWFDMIYGYGPEDKDIHHG